MKLTEAIIGRRSIRKFKEDQISDEVLLEIIKLAAHAPSPGNKQMWHFTVIKSREVREKLAGSIVDAMSAIAGAAGEDVKMDGPVRSATFFVNAPVLIAVSTARYHSKVDDALKLAGKKQEYIDDLRCRPDLQSIGGAIQTLLLAAYEKGLGTCWMTGPMAARPQMETILGIQPPRLLAAFIAIGVPAQNPAQKSLKDLPEIVTFIK